MIYLGIDGDGLLVHRPGVTLTMTPALIHIKLSNRKDSPAL